MADPMTSNPRASDALGENPTSRGGLDRPGRTDDSGRTREVVDEAKQQATSLAREAKEQGKSVLTQQKQGAAEQLDSMAGALHSAADDLQQRDQAQAGRFVAYAADQLESFGQRVRAKDIDSLISDAEQMGRRSPAAFFAGSVAVGFLLSRFLKSSARAREHDDRSRISDGDSDDRYRSFGDTRGMPSSGSTGGVNTGTSSGAEPQPRTTGNLAGSAGATAATAAGSRITAPTTPIGATPSSTSPTSANPNLNRGRSS